MAKKKPQLGLTDQLIVAHQVLHHAAKAELKTFRDACMENLSAAVTEASQGLIERSNATHEHGVLIVVSDWVGIPSYVPASVTGTTTHAVEFCFDGELRAAWPISERSEYFLVPEDEEIVIEHFNSPGVYTNMPVREIVKKLVTMSNIAKIRRGEGKFNELLRELELLVTPNHK
jgi:hypothetical protein